MVFGWQGGLGAGVENLGAVVCKCGGGDGLASTRDEEVSKDELCGGMFGARGQSLEVRAGFVVRINCGRV